jgi:hypothetical protein
MSHGNLQKGLKEKPLLRPKVLSRGSELLVVVQEAVEIPTCPPVLVLEGMDMRDSGMDLPFLDQHLKTQLHEPHLRKRESDEAGSLAAC